MIAPLGLRRESGRVLTWVHVQHKRYVSGIGTTWNPGGHIVSLRQFGNEAVYLEPHQGIVRTTGFAIKASIMVEP